MEVSPPQEEESKLPPAVAAGGDGEDESPEPRSGEEVEFAACDCCGMTEECTAAYIAGVRERHGGRWICGLCAEAVQDEICRFGLLISPEEAMVRHATFYRNFRSAKAPAAGSAEQLIAAVKQLLRRSLDSPRTVGSPCPPATVRPGPV